MIGHELNIIFDNGCGQNKNNMVLRLVAWLVQLGHFHKVNFIFLIVSNTKNVADRLFNSLKVQYREKESVHIQPVGGGIEFVTDYHSSSNLG